MGEALTLAERIRAVAAIDPEAEAIEQRGAWHQWGETSAAIERLAAELAAAGLGPGTEVAIPLRNRPHHVHAMAAVLANRCTIVTMNARQPPARTQAELAELGVPVLLADVEDLADPGLVAAVAEAGVLTAALGGPEPLSLVSPLDPGRSFAQGDAGVAVKMLTSGTTGPPKRVAFSAQGLKDSVLGAARLTPGPSNRKPGEEPELLLRRGFIPNWAPIEHVSGMWRAVEHMLEGRRLCLMETFDPAEWARVVKTYQVRMAMLAPATLRMVLDSGIDKSDLTSLKGVTSGTAPLSVELKEEFEQAFGIPVLPAYGATEFPGNGAGWTLADHESFGRSKVGSVGRARPGVQIRVVDEADGQPQASNEIGLVEILAQTAATPVGEDPAWLRTTDLGRLDEDGFLWIIGRADSAIICGGFKILATELVEAIEQHPQVREACVVGIPDDRLGAVPAAAVLPASADDPPTAEDLEGHCRALLPAYKIPREFRVVEDLPRTTSLKVSMPAVQDLFTR